MTTRDTDTRNPMVARAVRGVVAVFLLVVVPVGLCAALTGGTGTLAALLSSIFTLILVIAAGWRRALMFLPLLLLSTALGAVTEGTAAWVALLAGLGVASGLASALGLMAPFAVSGMLAAAAGSLGEMSAVTLLVAGLVGGYVIVVLRKLGVPAEVQGLRPSRREAAAGAVVLGAVVAVASIVAQRWDEPHAYYFPVFVFVLALPSPGVRVSEQARDRVIGTALGLVAVLPLAYVTLPVSVRVGLVCLLLVGYLAVSEPAWVRAALSTTMIVLALDPTAAGLAAGETRLVAVVTAAGLVLAGWGAVLWWVGRHPDWLDAPDLFEDPEPQPAS